jgi:hypothetical protein
MPPTYPLKIGSVTLNQDQFEGPDGNKEGLGDLGSKQKAVVREFPGGIVSAQLYGSFPKTIQWSGLLRTKTAFDRSRQLKALADNGELVNFSWADWNLDGFVEDYKAHAKGPFAVEYTITFKPLYDNNNFGGSNSAIANYDPFSGTVANAQNAMDEQAKNPASGTALPPTVLQGSVSFNQSVDNALQQSGGSVVNIPSSTVKSLQQQGNDLQQQLQGYINGPDPGLSSAAADLSGTLGIILTAFDNAVDNRLATIKAVDPNIYRLAEEYYGDAQYFQLILDANPQLNNDPLPATGVPSSIVIPVFNVASVKIPTVLDG